MDDEQKQRTFQIDSRIAAVRTLFYTTIYIFVFAYDQNLLDSFFSEEERNREELNSYNWELGTQMLSVAEPLVKFMIVFQTCTLVVFVWYPRIAVVFYVQTVIGFAIYWGCLPREMAN